MGLETTRMCSLIGIKPGRRPISQLGQVEHTPEEGLWSVRVEEGAGCHNPPQVPLPEAVLQYYGLNSSASRVTGRHYSTELHPQPVTLYFFQTGSC